MRSYNTGNIQTLEVIAVSDHFSAIGRCSYCDSAKTSQLTPTWRPSVTPKLTCVAGLHFKDWIERDREKNSID